PTADEVPAYRHVRGEVKAWNPFNGWIPIHFGDTKMAEILATRNIGQPVAELEILQDKDDGGDLHVPFSEKTKNTLMDQMDIPMQPTLHVPRTSVVGILDAVRNTILRWALELEEKGVIGEGMTFSK